MQRSSSWHAPYVSNPGNGNISTSMSFVVLCCPFVLFVFLVNSQKQFHREASRLGRGREPRLPRLLLWARNELQVLQQDRLHRRKLHYNSVQSQHSIEKPKKRLQFFSLDYSTTSAIYSTVWFTKICFSLEMNSSDRSRCLIVTATNGDRRQT